MEKELSSAEERDTTEQVAPQETNTVQQDIARETGTSETAAQQISQETVSSATSQPILSQETNTVQQDITREKKSSEREAHHHDAKEREMETLARKIEDQNNRDSGKKRRRWWIKTVLMLLLIAGSIAIMFTMSHYLSAEGTLHFSEMIRGVHPWYMLLFVGVILLYMVLESAKYAYLIRIQTGKWHLKIAVKTMYLGKYYDGITPLGTGGQPFQIYYMHKKKIPAGVATNVPLARYIVSTITFCLIAAVALILTSYFGFLDDAPVGETVIMVIASISLIANFAIPVAMIFVSVFPRAGKRVIAFFIMLLSKMHIVKRKYTVMKKYMYEVEEYRNSLKDAFARWWLLFPLILICVLEIAVYVAIPFFTVLAIAGPGVSDNLPFLFFETSCLCIVSFYSASLAPTPGSSGVSEAMTTLVFLAVTGIEGLVGWTVLLWRFANYYVYILTGIGINIFEVIRGAVRHRRQLKASPPSPSEKQE